VAQKAEALQEASRVLNYVMKDELDNAEKDQIVKDSIENFNEHVNPGWLIYRKSVSTNAAFVEWCILHLALNLQRESKRCRTRKSL